jgi:hypothetical protein
MKTIKTYSVFSADGKQIASGLDEKPAIAMTRLHCGATFRREIPTPQFAPSEQFTVHEWAEALRENERLNRD